MNSNTRFEIVAHAFQKDTRFIAPGKSVPDCMYQDENERQKAWKQWLSQHQEIINNLISSFEYIAEIDALEEELRIARIEAEDAKNERNRIELVTRREVTAEMIEKINYWKKEADHLQNQLTDIIENHNIQP